MLIRPLSEVPVNPPTARPDVGCETDSHIRVWDVAALVRAVADALAARFPGVAVAGEVSNFQRVSSGHCYFVLKDREGQAALRCVMFRRASALLDFSPKDGDSVEVRGRLTVYEPRGDLQFAVEAMERSGAGSLYEQFLRLKARFEADGLFDSARKRRVLPHPRAVGVVSSPDGAALHDALVALKRRAPHVKVIVYPTPVQGPGAAASIAAAIATANHRREVDTLLVCRGGGSIENLWAFNESAVVTAIANSDVPVICGVGHETDVSLADFAADVRAPTPTAAAELAAQPQLDGLSALKSAFDRLSMAVRNTLDRQAQRQDRLSTRLARPTQMLTALRGRVEGSGRSSRDATRRRIEREQQAFEQLRGRLQRAAPACVLNARHAHRLLSGRLDAVSPMKVLCRGYAYVTDARGHALVSAAQFVKGQAIRATLADGRVDAVVDQVDQASA